MQHQCKHMGAGCMHSCHILESFYLITMWRKESCVSMMVVTMDLPCTIDVVWSMVIILGEKGEGQSPFIRELNNSHAGHACIGYTIGIYHEWKTSASLNNPVGNNYSKHMCHAKEATLPWWNSHGLIEIPPCSHEPPDDRLSRIP